MPNNPTSQCCELCLADNKNLEFLAFKGMKPCLNPSCQCHTSKQEELDKEIDRIVNEFGAEGALVPLDIAIHTLLASQASEYRKHIGQLRQWLNEERITDRKLVTNEELEKWLL